MRRNGFQWPFDPLQVSSWFLFAAFIALTVAIVVPLLPGAGAWAFCVVYAILAVCTLVLAGRTTASNAIDQCVLNALEAEKSVTGSPAGRAARSSRRPFSLCTGATVRPWGSPSPAAPRPDAPAGEDLSYCYLCQVGVRRRSKHCKVCRKCVDEFDHHCVWLNVRHLGS